MLHLKLPTCPRRHSFTKRLVIHLRGAAREKVFQDLCNHHVRERSQIFRHDDFPTGAFACGLNKCINLRQRCRKTTLHLLPKIRQRRRNLHRLLQLLHLRRCDRDDLLANLVVQCLENASSPWLLWMAFFNSRHLSSAVVPAGKFGAKTIMDMPYTTDFTAGEDIPYSMAPRLQKSRSRPKTSFVVVMCFRCVCLLLLRHLLEHQIQIHRSIASLAVPPISLQSVSIFS